MMPDFFDTFAAHLDRYRVNPQRPIVPPVRGSKMPQD